MVCGGAPLPPLFHDEGLSIHLRGLFQTHQIQHGGAQVGQAAVPQLHAAGAHHAAGHQVGGVGGEGGAVGLHHVLGVAVVGGDDDLAAQLQGGGHHLAHAVVHRLGGLDGGLVHAGVAHHVAVGEVQNDDVIGAALDALDALGGDQRLGHLRLEVIGGHLGGGDQAAILAGEHLLHAAVEEEGDMGVLLRLRDAQLGHAQLGDILAEDVVQGLLGVGDDHVGHGRIVGGGAHIVQGEEALFALKALEVGIHQGAGDLPGPVGPEVHEQDGVPGANLGALAGDHGNHELVGDAGVIGLLHRVHRILVELGALAVDHGGVCLLQPIPVGVAIHGVVAALHGGDLRPVFVAGLLHLGYEALAGGGGHVAAVQEAVDVDLLRPQIVGQLDGGLDVGDVGVDAAVGHQAVDVDGPARLFGGVDGVHVGLVLEEGALLDGLGDLGQILEHHPARADVGVAHLAVAHLAVGQTHVQPGGGQPAHGVLGEQLIQVGGVGGGNGVVPRPGGGGQAKTVHDDQSSGCFHGENLRRLLIGRVDDGQEVVGLQGRAADEAAVDVGLGQQLRRVLGVHGAAVLDGDGPGHPGAELLADDGADVGADLAGLFGGGGLAGADGPDGLIGDDHAAHLVLGQAGQGGLHLIGDQLLGDAQLPLTQALAHADDGLQAGLQGGLDLLVDGEVGLVVVLAALGVADDDVLGAHVLEHLGGDLAGIGAGGLVVAGLAADGHPGVPESLDGAVHIDAGDAQYDLAPLVAAQVGLDGLGKGLGLGEGLVHLPVAGDDRLAVFQIHSGSDSFVRLYRFLRVEQAGHAGQLLALHELQGGAAAGGDVAHLVGVAQLLDGSRAVAAADDGDGAGLGQGLGHGLGAGGELVELKHAHGAVPDHGARVGHGLAVQLHGLGADVKALPAGGDLAGLDHLGVGVGGEGVGDDGVYGQEQADALLGGLLHHVVGVILPVGLQQGVAHLAALGGGEGIGHAAADDDGVGNFQ